jgi:hypothetical protein
MDTLHEIFITLSYKMKTHRRHKGSEMEHSALANVGGSCRNFCLDVVEANEGRSQCTDLRLKTEGNNSLLGSNFVIKILINIGGKLGAGSWGLGWWVKWGMGHRGLA